MKKDFEIWQGGHYTCLKDKLAPSAYGIAFEKGRVYISPEDGYLYTDRCVKDKPNVLSLHEFFRPSTEEEILSYRNFLKERLDLAGIEVGSRFRIMGLNSLNNMKVVDIDFDKEKMTFGSMTTHPDYQGNYAWPIQRVLQNMNGNQPNRWILIDGEGNDIVIPLAKKAIMDRVNDPSREASFTDSQIKALERYMTLFDESSREVVFGRLINEMSDDFKGECLPVKWVDDMRSELMGYAATGERKEHSQGLRM